ncbi:MAG: anti-sigma factor [Actinomycetota bacterium]|nr:anti-sigma factor [Actinomycetota bacterium]
MDDHRRFEEMLALRALGELGPEEERELNRHLEGCARCRDEEEALRLVHEELLGVSVPPPAHLKDRVMADLPQRRPRQRWRVPGVVLAAAVFLVALILGGAYAEFLGRTEAVASVASLAPTGLAPNASGEARVEDAGVNARVNLEVSGLPELRPGEYYELWFVKDGERISGGGFTVDDEGSATVTMNAPAPAEGYPSMGITREESPGDPRPSPTKVLGGELRRA